MARIHAAAFLRDRPWSEADLIATLAGPGAELVTTSNGFALARCVADEAELLTLAVHPEAQNQGEGHRLMALWMARASDRGATTAFLDVAADNAPALHLYAAHGFCVTGRRKGYYRRDDGTAADAVLMKRALPSGKATFSSL